MSYTVTVTFDDRETYRDNFKSERQAWEVHDAIRRALRRTYAKAITRDPDAGTGAHISLMGAQRHEIWVQVTK